MDSVETVHQAILTLYQNADTAAKEKANVWLNEFQNSLHAWQVCDQLLHLRQDSLSCYFAAHTMRYKIQFCFHELPKESYESLAQSILDQLRKADDAHSDDVVKRQLCLAIADLALQMPEWNTCIVDFMNRIENKRLLLAVLESVSEEVNNMSLHLGANRRQQLIGLLGQHSPMVLQLLEQCAEDEELKLPCLKCLGAWLGLGTMPTDQLAKSATLRMTYTVLATKESSSILHDAATDCVVQALRLVENISQHEQLALALWQLVHALFQQPFQVALATEDCDRISNFCRIVVELCEAFLMPMVDNPGQGLGSLEGLDMLLNAISYYDYTLAEMTFNLWYRLSEQLYQTDSDPLNAIFRPYFERLIMILLKHSTTDADYQGILDQDSELVEFRSKAAECVKDVIFVIGSSKFLTILYAYIQNIASNAKWEELEATLFLMSSFIRNIHPEEDEAVPEVVDLVLQIPANAHIMIRHTALLVLTELGEWLSIHSHLIERCFQFIVTSLQEQLLSATAAECLSTICDHCKSKALPCLPILLNLLAHNQMTVNLSDAAQISLLSAASTLLSSLQNEQITDHLATLCSPYCNALSALTKSNIASPESPVPYLDRLSAIFKHMAPNVANGSSHPCQVVVTQLWPVLSDCMNHYQDHSRVMEKLCRCVRYAIRCLGINSHSLLQPLVTQMVEIYQKHPHSCLLYLGSILVDEYGQETTCQLGLWQMMEAFIGPTFKLLQGEDGPTNHPDTVDDFFRLCIRFVQRAPQVIFSKSITAHLWACAVASIHLNHREAHSSLTKFLIEIIDLAYDGKKNHNNNEGAAIALVRNGGEELCKTILHAAVYSLPSSLISNVSQILWQMLKFDSSTCGDWLQSAFNNLPSSTRSGLPTITTEQSQVILLQILRADDQKMVTNALRDLIRLFY